MSIIVEIPDVGEVEFPSTMSQEEIRAAVMKIVGQSSARQTAPQPPIAPVAAPTAPVAPAMQAPVVPQAAPPVAPAAPPVTPAAPKPTPLQLYAPRTRVQQSTLPFQSVAEMGATPSAAFRAGAQTDRKAAIKEFAKARGIPESRYRIVGSDIVYQADDGKFYAEVPGILKAPTTSLAYVAPDIAEAIPSIGTGIISAPLMLTGLPGAAASVAMTGGTAAAANVARQKIAGLISGEDRPLDVGQAATSGLLDAATQLIPGGRAAVFNRRTASDIGQLDSAASANLQRMAQERGIQLTPAELTNLPSLKSQQKVLGNIPESSDVLGRFYEKRLQEQVQPAVDEFLGSISRVSDPMTAGFRGQTALKDQLEALKKQRKDLVDPYYDAAFDVAKPVDVKPIVSRIDSMLEIAKGEEKKELQRIKELMFREVTVKDAEGKEVTKKVLDDRLRALQRAKFAIDATLESDAVKTMDKVIQGEIGAIKNDLVTAMGVNNPKYLEANEAFATFSYPIERFLSKRPGLSLTNVSPDNLNQFASRVFEGASPQTVRYVRQQVEATNPAAWQDVTRSWLQQKWEKASGVTPGARDLPLDAGATWRNILFGNEKDRKVLQAALTKDQYTALTDLTTVLEAAGRVKKIGSDTAFNQKVLKDMGDQAGGFFQTVGKLAGGINLVAPLQFVSDWASKQQFGKNAESIAGIITSPDGMSRLRELRKLSPTSVKFWSGLSQLVVDSSAPVAEDLLAPTDYGFVQ
jgi:hypothetical protein